MRFGCVSFRACVQATPNVGSAWALPRNHPLWAPMDFEVQELETEAEEVRLEKIKKFEPPLARAGAELERKSGKSSEISPPHWLRRRS